MSNYYRYCEVCKEKTRALAWSDDLCPFCAITSAEEAAVIDAAEAAVVKKVSYEKSVAEGLAQQLAEKQANKRYVIVTDIQMPCDSMVRFMVKSALASIPAIIILGAIGFVVVAIISSAT